MSVPKEIRAVVRPCNTIVQDMGRPGPKRYAVRERKGINYKAGGNPQPVNGAVIGHITNGKFVPVKTTTGSEGPASKSYGGSALICSVSDDIVQDLVDVFPVNDAYTIMAIAALKILRPGITGSRMSTHYKPSFISSFFPGAAVSKNFVSSLYQKIGMDGTKREKFYQLRIARVSETHHIAIDGTLKQNTSTVNDLSAFSYKARLKGCEDISIIYAYDIENQEPVCCQVFPGNSVDSASYKYFIRDNKIKSGILVNDKGFPPSCIRNELDASPSLHCLTPVKRNDRRIEGLDLLNFEGIIPCIDKTVLFSKAKVRDNMFLYAYKDIARAANEERTFLESARNGAEYNSENHQKKNAKFGLFVLESDLDMEPSIAYSCYAERWKLELVFKTYKNDDCLDRTSVQGDFSVHGSEFVNFISTLITTRIITKATAAGLLNDMTLGNMIEDLNTAWRKVDAPIDQKPKQNDPYWEQTIPKVFEMLVKLGLCEPLPKPEPKRRGRKPGVKKTAAKEKRPIGRPRKNPPRDPNSPKRPVGRPRKNPIVSDAEKRPVGRPRTRPLPDPNQPKRPVGRPRKAPER